MSVFRSFPLTRGASRGWLATTTLALLVAHELTFQVNGVNLLDESYISTIGTNGFTVRGDNQTLQAGTRRLLFFTVSALF